MKVILKVMLILISLSYGITPQQYNYWNGAPVEGSKIYSICFTDQRNGYAVSTSNEIFITTDSGMTWKYRLDDLEIKKSNNDKIIWSADIYCSIMKTTDGGANWLPYSKEKQDHFCKVYLKDPNVGYCTAYEFLKKVTEKIFINIKSNAIVKLINQPQQCTEYYSNESEGWALGWCVKDLQIKDK
jgi:hypothetical protein